MTSWKSQGREYARTEIHAAGLQGEDNQLLTMISRCKGSPWAGSLRLTGITMARGKDPQVDLQKKMKPFAKSLLVAKLLGMNVDQAKYDAVLESVLSVDPNWPRVEKAIIGRVL